MVRFGRGALSAMKGKAGFGGSSSNIGSAVDAIGKRALAEKMSGTSDRSSRSYKNARDYISRHLRGSRQSVKSPKYGNAIAAANKEAEKKKIKNRGTLTVSVEGSFTISKKKWRKGRMKTTLTGSNLDDYMNAVDKGDMHSAIGIVSDSYGKGDMPTPTINSITSVEYS